MISQPSSRRAVVLARSPGVQLLRDAWECAREVKLDLWQLAVEIDALHQAGLTNTDLRWLLSCGLSSHGEELTRPADPRRRFCKVKSLALGDDNCFVLTAAGYRFGQPRSAVKEEFENKADTESPAPLSRSPARGRNLPASMARGTSAAPLPVESRKEVPCWDANLHELSFGGQIIKRFVRPAPAQEMILSVFQEEGWRPGIDDPLPNQFHQDPKRRLHYTVQNLNRGQKPASIHFFINGNGQLVRWRPIAAPRKARRSATR